MCLTHSQCQGKSSKPLANHRNQPSRQPAKDRVFQHNLPTAVIAEQPIYAVFVHRNYMPTKTRAFIDFLANELPKLNSEAQ
jgi:DNA-binding transcriptional LysR family regulator